MANIGVACKVVKFLSFIAETKSNIMKGYLVKTFYRKGCHYFDCYDVSNTSVTVNKFLDDIDWVNDFDWDDDDESIKPAFEKFSRKVMSSSSGCDISQMLDELLP
jgi:hypothetical protein